MVGCTLPCHLSLVVGDKSAARGGRSATHYEARVERRAADGIEAPNQPSLLPAPAAVMGRESVGGNAVNRTGARDVERSTVLQRLDGPGQARIARFEHVTEIADRVTDAWAGAAYPNQWMGRARMPRPPGVST